MTLKTEEIRARGIRFSLERGGREVAHAYLYLGYNDLHPGQPFGLLEDVYVVEEMRKRGWGVRLIKEVFTAARELGCYKLIATSRHSRPEVHQLYLRLGFRHHGKEFRIDF